MDAQQPEEVLRAKYLDWCSARIADHFLQLTPEEIYRLAHAEEEGVGSGGGSESAESDASRDAGAGNRPGPALSYRDLVERVTEALSRRLELPPFEEWERGYRREPARYEAELLGFWKSSAR